MRYDVVNFWDDTLFECQKNKFYFLYLYNTMTNIKESSIWQTVEEQIDNNERIEWVLEDMEDIKFHCDFRYCNWDECKQQVKQSIIKRLPKQSEK